MNRMFYYGHIWECGDREIAWANEKTETHPGIDSRCISTVGLENRKSRILFPAEKSVFFSATPNEKKKKPRSLSIVSIARPKRNPVRPATAYELSAIRKALSLGDSEVKLAAIKRTKPSVYVTEPADEEENEAVNSFDGVSKLFESDQIEDTENNRNSMTKTGKEKLDNVDDDEEIALTLFTSSNNDDHTMQRKRTRLKSGYTGHYIGKSKSDGFVNSRRRPISKEKRYPEHQGESLDETNSFVSMRKQLENYTRFENDVIFNGRYGDKLPDNIDAKIRLLPAGDNIRVVKHKNKVESKPEQKHVKINCTSFIEFKRPETAPDNLKYVHKEINKTSKEGGEQLPEKPQSGIMRSLRNYSGLTRSRSKSRSQKKRGLFDKDEGPTLLELHKKGVELADYEGKVKEFSLKLIPFKAGEHHITDYYVSRLLEQNSRDADKNACTLRFISKSPEVEGARVNKLSRIPNLTFKTINFHLGNKSSSTVSEYLY